MVEMKFEALEQNKIVFGAAFAVLLVLGAGVFLQGPDSNSPGENIADSPVTPSTSSDTPENSETSGEVENTDESDSRFISVEKNYEVLEIDAVGSEVAVRGSIDEGEILELGSEIIANETVISEFRGVAGELYYVLNRNGSKYVFNDGEPVSDGYSMIPEIRDVGGVPTYTVQDNLMPSYIVRDGEDVGTQYYEVKWPAWVNGELAYKAVDGTQNLIVHGGEEQERYDEVGYPIEAEGELTYRVQEGNTEFIKHGDERLASNYSSVEGVWESRGMLTYVVNDQGELKLMRNGEDILEDEWQLHPDTITWIDGKLAFFVTIGNDEYLVYNGERVGEDFNIQHSKGLIANADGTLAFAAKKDSKWHIVREK